MTRRIRTAFVQPNKHTAVASHVQIFLLFFHFRSRTRSHSHRFPVDLPLVSIFICGCWWEWVRERKNLMCCTHYTLMALTSASRQSQCVRIYWQTESYTQLEPNAVARREIDCGARWNCCMNFYCVGVMNLILEHVYVSASRIWQLRKYCTLFSLRCEYARTA